MKHVPKQQWMGCAVATAAMIADLSYEDVAALRPDLDEARMRWPKELCSLLKGVTKIEWKLTSWWYPRRALHQFAFPQWPVAVFIQDAPFRPRVGQWVVVKGEIVHDPGAWTAHTVSRYPRRDWRVSSVAEPVRPAEFARNQARRHLQKLRNVLRLEG